MLRDVLIAIVLIPTLLLCWLLVQSVSRRFSKAHPELGPAREEGAGCGKSCLCSGSSCQREDKDNRPKGNNHV
ncbi:MAG: chemotaxis protein [Gammaproteobacteria bacterium (ex Lamellibrachia satsuma)]|nr:MAG: chemotaxis protein [Gammaproteobacteria bacterium (ex Lamellibrachia satsuma)]